jgi:hypothetical protein
MVGRGTVVGDTIIKWIERILRGVVIERGRWGGRGRGRRGGDVKRVEEMGIHDWRTVLVLGGGRRGVLGKRGVL